jgi:hypothetical protein
LPSSFLSNHNCVLQTVSSLPWRLNDLLAVSGLQVRLGFHGCSPVLGFFRGLISEVIAMLLPLR